MSITPVVGDATSVAAGGTPVVAIAAGSQGGYIVNPALAADQNLVSVEPLYVDIVNSAILGGYNTTVALAPGQSFTVIAGLATDVSVNAASTGHRFTCVKYTGT